MKRYHPIPVALPWLIALMILVALAAGARSTWVYLHASGGVDRAAYRGPTVHIFTFGKGI